MKSKQTLVLYLLSKELGKHKQRLNLRVGLAEIEMSIFAHFGKMIKVK